MSVFQKNAGGTIQLGQADVARRLGLSPRTLERWRWLKIGPSYLKVGGRVRYLLADIESFEADCRRKTR